MTEDIKLIFGDCLEKMKEIPEKSIDLILCDLPYGNTAHEWDSVITLDELWKEYKRIIKNCGTIVLFGSESFSSYLRISNIDWFSYDWIWEKENGANFLSIKKVPMKIYEIISIFKNHSIDTTNYFENLKAYLISEKKKTGLTDKQLYKLLGNYMMSHYFTTKSQFAIPSKENYIKLQSTGYFKRPYEELKEEYDKEMSNIERHIYNPQFSDGKPYSCTSITKRENLNIYNKKNFESVENINNGYRYPTTILKFKKDKEKLHPTQKPVALLEYLIKTYTNEGMVVLDNCMGSGSTGIACININRKFIGIEKDENYFEIAKKRIENHKKEEQPI